MINDNNNGYLGFLMVFIFFSVCLFGFMGSSFAVTGNNSSSLNSSNITNNTNNTNITVTMNQSQIQGYYINGADTPVNTINPAALKAQGVNTVYVYTDRQDPSGTLQPFITKFNGTGISVYAWVESFKDFNDNWFNPETNPALENQIISDINSIALNYNVNGVMLDYLRYPGTAYEYPNASIAVDNFTAAIRSNINSVNNLNITGKPEILIIGGVNAGGCG